MRFVNTQKSAATKAKTMPFAGLGFDTDAVHNVAQIMTVTIHNHAGNESIALPTPDAVQQPSGYSLLVTLSREIRGR